MIKSIFEHNIQDCPSCTHGAAIAFIFATFFVAKILSILPSYITKRKYNQAKISPYECGTSASDKNLEKLSVGFELVAMMFLIFDCEIIFLIPAAANIKHTSFLQFSSIALFISILTLALIYEIKKGLLKW